jgi:hypothetical protein
MLSGRSCLMDMPAAVCADQQLGLGPGAAGPQRHDRSLVRCGTISVLTSLTVRVSPVVEDRVNCEF